MTWTWIDACRTFNRDRIGDTKTIGGRCDLRIGICHDSDVGHFAGNLSHLE